LKGSNLLQNLSAIWGSAFLEALPVESIDKDDLKNDQIKIT
jgi:hypothetical protein